VWLVLAIACSLLTEEPPAAPAPAPAVATASAPTSTTRFVRASRLNLRAEPDKAARSLGRLDINSPIEPVESRDGWVKVRTRNGKEGWLSQDFIGEERLTVAAATASAQAAANPEEALSWWQRAAAIEPMDPTVLTGLAAAYRATGDEGTATRVERQLGWPQTMFPVTTGFGEGPHVEWSTSVDYEGFDWDADRTIARADWAKHGVRADESWSVLPDAGPAVAATVKGVRYALLNECGGTLGIVVDLDFALPDGRTAVAAARGAAPPSWREPGPAPVVGKEVALEALKAEATRRGYRESAPYRGLGVAPDGDGWVGRAAWLPPGTTEDEDGVWWPDLDGIDVRVDASGALTVVEELKGLGSLGIRLPIARRDLLGDGAIETVWSSGCDEAVTRPDGTQIATTEFRCCGC
jgi:SH3-like domain-containing protein